MKGSVLIVEDEAGIVLTLEDRFTSEGYTVHSARDGISGEKEAREGVYDIVILDIMLPGKDGFQVCSDLRRDGVDTPILILTARGSNIDTVMGLKIGADDYLTKPFDMQVLTARVEALIRRAGRRGRLRSPDMRVYQFGKFSFDTEKQELSAADEVIPLNAQEYRLLKHFLEHPEKVFSRDDLLNEVWGYDTETTTRTVDVHVAWLRKKLHDLPVPRYLVTVRGYGYRFNPDG